jgi:hypothetical protein
MADLEDIRSRLDTISDELADLAMDALRDAVRSGAKKSEAERRLTRARTAVVKAARLLDEQGSVDD